MAIIRARWTLAGSHIHIRFFYATGPRAQSMLLGKLVLDKTELVDLQMAMPGVTFIHEPPGAGKEVENARTFKEAEASTGSRSVDGLQQGDRNPSERGERGDTTEGEE